MSGELSRWGGSQEVVASIVDEDDLKVMRAKAMIYPFLSPEQAEKVGRVLDEVFTPKDDLMSDDEIVAAFVSAKTIEGLSPKTIRGPAPSYLGAMKLVMMVLLPSPWVWAYMPSPPQS